MKTSKPLNFHVLNMFVMKLVLTRRSNVFYSFLHAFSVLLLLFNVLMILFYFFCLLACIASKIIVHAYRRRAVRESARPGESIVYNQHHMVKEGKCP